MSLVDNYAYRKAFGYGGITPDRCKSLRIERTASSNILSWKDPEDTYIENKLVSSWEKTVIVRKAGAYPTSLLDGEKVLENNVRNKYAKGYVDSDFAEDENPKDFYYRAFPVADTGAIGSNAVNNFVECIVYGFKRAKNNSAPSTRVTPTDDAIGMVPAYMDFGTGSFNYGSWADTFIMDSFTPGMLSPDGKFKELNKNDHAKYADGSDAPIADSSQLANAMVRVKKMYVSRSEDNTYEYFRVSNLKADDSFAPVAFHDKNGNEVDYFYISMFKGSVSGGRLRSLASKTVTSENTSGTEKSYAQANGENWNRRTIAQRCLINDLLTLISMSSDSQAAFGKGVCGNTSANGVGYCVKTGTLIKKGMFFGSSGTGTDVKVFGIENWWGNQWDRIDGAIAKDNVLYVKEHGPYDDNGADGYVNTGIALSGTSGGYISKLANSIVGFLPKQVSGSGTTYECDGAWFATGTNVVLVGADVNSAATLPGASAFAAYFPASDSAWDCGASLSYTPLAEQAN